MGTHVRGGAAAHEEGRGAVRLRALAVIAAGLLVCNAAAAAGLWLVDVEPAARSGRSHPIIALLVWIFNPGSAPFTFADFARDRFLERAWVHWDSRWYAIIVGEGYWYTPGEQSPVAYFPAYPLLVRTLTVLGLNRFVAGILLSAALGCAALFLFNRWAAHLVGESRALRATVLFVLYPFSFFLFGAMYSDATFLCAAVGAFTALERGRLGTAALLGAIATAARPIGPAVVLGLVARRLELRAAAGERSSARDLVPALSGLGLGAYMLFLWLRFGDPLAFVHVQSAPGWDHLVGPSSYLKLPFFELLMREANDSGPYVRMLHAALALTAFACAVPLWRRVSKGYAVYVAVAVGMPLLSSKDFMGLGRYTIAAFPVFVVLALMLETRPVVRRAVMVAAAGTLVFFTMLFAADNFVA